MGYINFFSQPFALGKPKIHRKNNFKKKKLQLKLHCILCLSQKAQNIPVGYNEQNV